MKTNSSYLTGAVGVGLSILAALAQTNASAQETLGRCVLVPQTRVLRDSGVQVVQVDAVVDVIEQVATTTLDLTLTNRSHARLEAELVVPVPAGIALRGFDFQGAGQEPSAKLLDKDEARRLYDAIVAKLRDPALVEFAGYSLIQSSVFPVEACGSQKVRLVYEEILPADGDRIDYVLPRSESIDYRVPWQVKVHLRSARPIATAYSPSHQFDVVRVGPGRLEVRLAPQSATSPGSFRLSFLREGHDGMSASLLAYPDAALGGGYFLLLAAAPKKPLDQKAVQREVILVLDRSGSMNGEKIEQARAAALQVLEGLEEGEAFNIIVYSDSVESFAAESVIKTPAIMEAARNFLRGIMTASGTNIHDALREALGMKPRAGFLPLVLFLTDGLPTVGQTSELAIRNLALQANPHGRRIFTFGVGVDVNTPLLDRLATASRGAATFVLPKEDVEVKVGQVFRRLAGPVLAAPQLSGELDLSCRAVSRIRELAPAQLPDLFEGDQLVVLGQYVGDAPLQLTLTGNHGGKERSFEFKFDLGRATSKHAFVPRLWASRKIAMLTDAIRDLGAVGQPTGDPRLKELVDEIVRYSKQFGILTEYTAFLAEEGTDLGRPDLLLTHALTNFQERAVNTRTGYASVNQDVNNGLQRVLGCVNPLNGFYDAQMNRVTVNNVQQINDCAFYRRGQRWIDSRLLDASPAAPQAREVAVGSEEFRRLAERLAQQNRQGCVSLQGEILLRVGEETILIK